MDRKFCPSPGASTSLVARMLEVLGNHFLNKKTAQGGKPHPNHGSDAILKRTRVGPWAVVWRPLI